MATIDQTDFDEVTQCVLRNFLRSIGWSPERYLVSKVDPGTLAVSPEEVVDRCHALALRAKGNFTAKEVADPLIRLAMLLDQRAASSRHLLGAIPEALLNMSAIGCLMAARALLREGKIDEGIGFIHKGIAINPGIGSLHHELGLLSKAGGNYREAMVRLEWSIHLRSVLRPDLHLPVDSHLLVARPSEDVEIHYYRSHFYVYRKSPDSVRIMPIGSELYELHRNAAYRLGRFIFHLPLLRPVLLKVARRIAGGASAEAATTQKPSAGPAPKSRRIRIPQVDWRPAVRRIALKLFVRPVKPRTATLTEALASAGAFAGPAQEK